MCTFDACAKSCHYVVQPIAGDDNLDSRIGMAVSHEFDLLYVKVIARINDQKKQLVGSNLAIQQIIARRCRSLDAEIG